jgi:hypothetical protein
MPMCGPSVILPFLVFLFPLSGGKQERKGRFYPHGELCGRNDSTSQRPYVKFPFSTICMFIAWRTQHWQVLFASKQGIQRRFVLNFYDPLKPQLVQIAFKDSFPLHVSGDWILFLAENSSVYRTQQIRNLLYRLPDDEDGAFEMLLFLK